MEFVGIRDGVTAIEMTLTASMAILIMSVKVMSMMMLTLVMIAMKMV